MTATTVAQKRTSNCSRRSGRTTFRGKTKSASGELRSLLRVLGSEASNFKGTGRTPFKLKFQSGDNRRRGDGPKYLKPPRGDKSTQIPPKIKLVDRK